MTGRLNWNRVAPLLLALFFVAGLLPLAPPVKAIQLEGPFSDLVKIFSVGFIVQEYGEDMDAVINSFLAQEEAEIAGQTKVVTIIRVGDGTQVGAAQVMGPSDKLDTVQAVAQLDWTPGDVRGRALLPVTTAEDLTSSVRGVSGVGVSAVIAFPL
jgi:hypothetical protein